MASKIGKTIIKRGRKRRRGRPSNKVKELMKSRDISRTEAEKLAKKETSSKKKTSSKPKTKKRKPVDEFAIPKGLTRAEEKEYINLIKQYKKDKKESKFGQTDKIPNRVGETERETLSINAPIRSKEKPPERKDLSSAQLRRLVTSGLAGVGKKGQVTDKGTYSSGANVGQKMMRGDVGGDVDMKALENELRTIGGFEGLKSGGKVGIGRGCGVAMRGAGAVRKS
jgi:hypothetical protein